MMYDTLLSSQSNTKFSEARRRAFLQNVLSALQPNLPQLLPFDAVQRYLQLKNTRNLGIQDIDLNKIVGSVGRYRDFTREFLPRSNKQAQRWRRIYDLAHAFKGFPPIEVFKVGQVYFVRDGNHRVSVARMNGLTSIEAQITEYLTPIKLSPSDSLDDVLIKAEALQFFDITHLHRLRPEQNLHLTNPGRYRLLLEHIETHKYLRSVSQGYEMAYPDAVASWYDTVYLPIVADIRARNLLAQFPGRTETDLYAWILLHRAELEKSYGFGQVDNAQIMDALAKERPPLSLWQKLQQMLKQVFTPGAA